MTQPRDFGFTEEAKLLKQSARSFFQKKLPTEKLHKLIANESDPFRVASAKWDRDLWHEMTELGWSSLAVPESAGGIGMPAVAVAGLVEEAGRAALPSPLLSTLQACYVLSACEPEFSQAGFDLIQQGKSISLAIVSSVDTEKKEEKPVLNGAASFVQDAAKADYFIVKADGLFLVDAKAQGVNIIADHIVDLTRDQAHIEFTDVMAKLLAGNADVVLKQAEPALLTLLAADMAGAAEWQLQTTVEYAKTRVQFDHPIGFFQGVKHPLVDLMLLVDQARALVYNAACAIDHDQHNSEKFARMAKASACDAASFASRKSVQLHGGIGFTWECFVHLYSKRQKHSQMLCGDAAYHRRKLAELLIDK
jgi:alkylation response protein AidB-like acyl-CoA dehydrogenase